MSNHLPRFESRQRFPLRKTREAPLPNNHPNHPLARNPPHNDQLKQRTLKLFINFVHIEKYVARIIPLFPPGDFVHLFNVNSRVDSVLSYHK